MKAKKLIEMVCTGNTGRSPVAELIAHNYLSGSGLLDEYGACSSGTRVSVKVGEGPKSNIFSRFVKLAQQRDIYSVKDRKEVSNALEEGDVQALRCYFTQAIDRFTQEEIEHRAEALPYFGIKGDVKEKPEQTIVKPNLLAILTMDERNKKLVEKIYESSDYDPNVDVLSRVATGNSKAELPNAFGKGRDVYFAGIEQLIREVPLALKNIMGG